MKRFLSGMASLTAFALPAADPDAAPPPAPDLTLRLGGQADNAHGSDFQGRFDWNATKALNLFLGGDRFNLPSTPAAPSPDGSATLTTTASLGGGYAFGLFCLGLHYTQVDMSKLLTSRRYFLQPALDGGTWRLGLEFSRRTTDFDPVQFRSQAIKSPTGPTYVTGYADMNLSDTGVGIDAEVRTSVWRLYGSYVRNSYGSYEGTTNVSQIGNVNSDVFNALSGRLVKQLERLSASTLSRNAALLDSSLKVGAEASLRLSRWGLEIGHDVDHTTGQASNVCTGIAAWKVTPGFTLEIQAGATRSDAFGTTSFAGLYLIFRTQPIS
ncbi:hypothetical protein [Mesoterricola silvestris]|uniref:Transporter n=1 Tax=Mesoterricola silvestris TaxID=2927979 RepID=A0AA48H451_9BACT|nr:hypothetical protein [Mesoterricola silvestris]BDU71523.1 hypothetical protein METEAL_06970 [Mesoterricola silvestris]